MLWVFDKQDEASEPQTRTLQRLLSLLSFVVLTSCVFLRVRAAFVIQALPWDEDRVGVYVETYFKYVAPSQPTDKREVAKKYQRRPTSSQCPGGLLD